MEEYGVKEYTVIERNGLRIGIFGIMGEESASMAPMSGVTFTDEVASAKRVVRILKEQEQADLILCLSHSGTNIDKSASEDEILAKEVPDIDVIISGHTHTKLAEPIIVGDTIIGSGEDYGKYLGVIKVTQDSVGDWKLGNYELVQINDSLVEDSGVAQRIEIFKNKVQTDYFNMYNLGYDEVIANSPFQFQTTDEFSSVHADSTIGNLIGDAYIYAVKQAEGDSYEPVTAAVVPTGTIRSTIFQGPITSSDAFCVSSLGVGADGIPGYPVISVYLTGKELKTMCEVDASIAPIMSTAQLYISGLSYTFNPNRLIFNKVIDTSLMSADGSKEEIEDKKLYRVVCGLYSAQMLSVVGDKSFGIMSIVPKNKAGEPITDFEDYIIYQNVNGNKQEVKEWFSIVEYLKSFDAVDGVPQIPDYYKVTHGRKNIYDNKSIIALLKNPNGIALAVYIAVPVITALLILLLNKLVKIIRRKRRKQ
jgi:2',3'-cyclic-nucleotide 2'-phosphodiesterase (5'-nucleotidase family)